MIELVAGLTLMLSRVATSFLDKPVTVSCGNYSHAGDAQVGGNWIGLDRMSVCSGFSRAPGPWKSFSLFVFTHEMGHSSGIKSERKADCFALRNVVRVARVYFRYGRPDSRRLLRDARSIHSHADPEYRDPC